MAEFAPNRDRTARVAGGAAVGEVAAVSRFEALNCRVQAPNILDDSLPAVPEVRPASVPPAATRAALTSRPAVRMMAMMTFSVFMVDSPQSPAMDVAICAASSKTPLYARHVEANR